MADLNINETRARADAATRGPWSPVDLRHQRGGQIRIFAKGTSYLANVLARGDNPAADAEFIAHAREDVPALLDEIERLRGLVRAVIDLTKSTDGDELSPDAEIPVGELYRVLYVEAASRG